MFRLTRCSPQAPKPFPRNEKPFHVAITPGTEKINLSARRKRTNVKQKISLIISPFGRKPATITSTTVATVLKSHTRSWKDHRSGKPVSSKPARQCSTANARNQLRRTIFGQLQAAASRGDQVSQRRTRALERSLDSLNCACLVRFLLGFAVTTRVPSGTGSPCPGKS